MTLFIGQLCRMAAHIKEMDDVVGMDHVFGRSCLVPQITIPLVAWSCRANQLASSTFDFPSMLYPPTFQKDIKMTTVYLFLSF